MDGGEWKDGKWYSKFHRDAWIKAVKPYADEIERLRRDVEEANARAYVMAKEVTLWQSRAALKEGE